MSFDLCSLLIFFVVNDSLLAFDRGCYFQVGSSLKLGMSIPSAYRIALETWTSWIEREIDKNRTRVFFRTFEPSHWRYSHITDNTICLICIYVLDFDI